MEKRSATIQDIAKIANVSKSTVSRVINNTTHVAPEKRDAVLNAMKELDFQPNVFARGLARGQSMTIGVLTQIIGSPFYDLVTQGVIEALNGTSYSPIVVDGRWNIDSEVTALKTLLDRQVDGLVIVGGTLSVEKLTSVRESKPLIMVAREISEFEKHCVHINNFKAAYEATEYLIRLGHTKIAHIQGIPSHDDAIQRLAGFKAAMTDAGLSVDESLIYEGDFHGQSGLMGVEVLLQRSVEFTALFVANDEMAFGAQLGLYRRNIKVPDDVSIIGFDDQPTAAFTTPPLTTVKQPALQMGSAASKALVSILEGNSFELPEVQAKLVIRESTARLKN